MSTVNAFKWQESPRQIKAAEFRQQVNKNSGKAPPLLNGSARNATTSNNTEPLRIVRTKQAAI